MKPEIAKNGYYQVTLWKEGKKKKPLIHRLVAAAFVDNPRGYGEVNHIDEVKGNNRADNLEWCDHAYNMNYGMIKKKIGDANKGRRVSAELRQRNSDRMRGLKWINNGEIERYVSKDDVKRFVCDGWKVGRKERKRKTV